MSEWDFLWDLEGQELEDAMSCGMTRSDMDYIENQERDREWTKLKELRDSTQITMDEFKLRKQELFAHTLDD
jgi:hypothetical protein